MNEGSFNNQPPESVAVVHERPKNNFWKEIIKFTIIVLVVVIPFRAYVAQPFIVSGGSMDPTFADGQYLIVDQLSKRIEQPPRESVVIFRYPNDTTKFFIKRIIGLPGETVKIRNGIVTIFNKDFPESKGVGITLKEPYIADENKKVEDFRAVLNDGEYFVMGDNRLGSFDSRAWGPVPEDLIIGRPIVRLFPVNELNILPGDYSK